MTDVVIAGVGQIEVGEHWDLSLRQLGVRAMLAAVKDAGGLVPQALFVGNMLGPNLSRQAHVAALLADNANYRGIEAVTIEAAGASGAAALRQGYMAIMSGMVDVALVVGVEKFTDVIGAEVEEAIATAMDGDYESIHGMTVTGQAAMLTRRYMHEYKVPAGGFAGFSMNAHANGVGNKFAMFRKAIKLETYQKAETVSDPLNMFDVAPNADGAAAVLLTRSDLLPKDFIHPLVKIIASSNTVDTLAIHDRPNPLLFNAARISVEQVLQKAGITREEISFFEYHDSFSVFAALSLEAAGFITPGEAWKLAADTSLTLKGRLPCATMGGLKARGNPGGATGVYQAVEATLQLRGSAGANQLNAPLYGLIQSLGGPASTAITHILQRVA